MSSFLDNFLSASEQKKISEFSRKAKNELSSLPVISAIGDSVQGASGLGELQQKLKAEPNNPKNWLYYYEAFSIYKKINSGVNVGRGIINPVGFVVGKGVATGLNAVDDAYEVFDPKKCLGMVIALTMDKVKNAEKKMKSEEYVVLAKALVYSAGYVNDTGQKDKMCQQAISYTSKAIQLEKSKRMQAEYFFYLSQFYDQQSNRQMKMRALNISRKLGFLPAEKLLKTLVIKENSREELKQSLENMRTHTPYRNFLFTYHPDVDSRIENTWSHVKEQQQKKFSETGKRLGKFLEKHL